MKREKVGSKRRKKEKDSFSFYVASTNVEDMTDAGFLLTCYARMKKKKMKLL